MHQKRVFVLACVLFLFLLSACSQERNLSGKAVDTASQTYIQSVSIHSPLNMSASTGIFFANVSVLPADLTGVVARARISGSETWTTLTLTDGYWTGIVDGTALPDDAYSFEVNVSEDHGTSVLSQVDEIAVDKAPPIITLLAPAPGAVLNTSNVSFTARVDQELGLKSISLIIDGEPNMTLQGIPETYEYNFSALLANGTHSWSVHGFDYAGLNNSQIATSNQLTITIPANDTTATNTTTLLNDTTPPIVQNASMNTTSALENESIIVNVSVVDTNSSISQVLAGSAQNITLTNSTPSTFSAITTPKTLGCSINMTCTIRFYVNDSAGNRNDTVTTTIFVNISLPVNTSANTSPTNTTNTTNQSSSATNMTNTTASNTSTTAQNTQTNKTATVPNTTLSQVPPPQRQVPPPVQPANPSPAPAPNPQPSPSPQQQAGAAGFVDAPEEQKKPATLLIEEPATTEDENSLLLIGALFIAGVFLLGGAGFLIHWATLSTPAQQQPLPFMRSTPTGGGRPTTTFTRMPSPDVRRGTIINTMREQPASLLETYNVRQPLFRRILQPESRRQQQAQQSFTPRSTLPPARTEPIIREETVIRERPTLEGVRGVASGVKGKKNASRLSTDYAEQLNTFITESIKLGYPPREIAQGLINKGWSLKQIEEAFEQRGLKV